MVFRSRFFGWRRGRVLLAVIVIAITGTLITWPANGEVNLPAGSCYGSTYFDGVNTTGDPGPCRDGLRVAGYGGSALYNQSATTPLIRLTLDGVFHFSGHSIASFLAPNAIGLIFQKGSKFDVLLGDPTAAPWVEGPVSFCSVNGGCVSTTLVSYPWANLLAKHNLVILQGCVTAQTSLVYRSIAQTAWLAGAGNVIGFRTNTTAPSSWSNTFWTNARNGVSYATSVAAAAGACCGYGSYVHLKNPAAPTSLYPRKYYPVPVPTNDPLLNVAGAGNQDVRSQALARALGHDLLGPKVSWRSVDYGYGAVWQVYRPDVGLFELDPRTLQLTKAVFERQLSIHSGAQRIVQSVAKDAASAFAQTRVASFDQLAQRSVEYVDHQSFDEYIFTWQARTAEAWLPTRVVVGVNASTGRIAHFDSQAITTTMSTVPTIQAEAARRAAIKASGISGPVTTTTPELEIIRTRNGDLRLAWITHVTGVPQGRVYVPRYSVIAVDAHQGATWPMQ